MMNQFIADGWISQWLWIKYPIISAFWNPTNSTELPTRRPPTPTTSSGLSSGQVRMLPIYAKSHELHVVSYHRQLKYLFNSLPGYQQRIYQRSALYNAFWRVYSGVCRVDSPHKGPVLIRPFSQICHIDLEESNSLFWCRLHETRVIHFENPFLGFVLKFALLSLHLRRSEVGPALFFLNAMYRFHYHQPSLSWWSYDWSMSETVLFLKKDCSGQ